MYRTMYWPLLLLLLLFLVACETRSAEEEELDRKVRETANFLTEGDWEPSNEELKTACQELNDGGWSDAEVRRKLLWEAENPTEADALIFRTANAIVSRTSASSYCSSWLVE